MDLKECQNEECHIFIERDMAFCMECGAPQFDREALIKKIDQYIKAAMASNHAVHKVACKIADLFLENGIERVRVNVKAFHSLQKQLDIKLSWMLEASEKLNEREVPEVKFDAKT